MATKNAYRENGYNSRSEYLESLADDYGLAGTALWRIGFED